VIEKWIEEVKLNAKSDDLGMILIHNGIVRGTSKEGKKVKGIHLSYDKEKLNSLIKEYEKNKGIVAIKAWINEGTLNIGDNIMYLLVAGRLRTDVLPTFEELLSKIKREIVSEKEFS
jgi:molybdopterin synthase catalytic subunit